jgi:predicted dehydrogenase
MGNQGHSTDDARLVNEHLQAGTIGEVREVHAWTNRPIWPQGMAMPTDLKRTPQTLNWDLYLGPAPEVAYDPAFHSFSWRGWVDYGTGALGDMGAHLLDTPTGRSSWGRRRRWRRAPLPSTGPPTRTPR